jgi:small subunit ribosomal protein S19
MTRSTWKTPYSTTSILKKLKQRKTSISLFTKNATILPQLVGLTIHVYNGQRLLPVLIQEPMIGHKLGEFVLTRKRHVYVKKKKKR